MSTHPAKLVLVDDDSLIRSLWTLQAKKRNIVLDCFENFDQLRERLNPIQGEDRVATALESSEYASDTCFFIDSNLTDDGPRGEVLAKELYDRGFTNLYLQTGDQDVDPALYPWIRDIQGKEFPSYL